MSVSLTIELSASEFDIGRVIEAVDGAHVELETVVPVGDQAMPVLHVQNREHDHDAFVKRLEDHSAVVTVVTLDRSESSGTYAVEWTEDPDSFYRALSDHNAVITSATKDGDRWEFDLQFPSHGSLTGFRDQIDEEEIDLEVRRVVQSQQSLPSPENGLSRAQREALDLAISEGYYSVPRRTTTAELAEQLGVSDQAVIERLRRAMTTLGREYMTASREDPST